MFFLCGTRRNLGRIAIESNTDTCFYSWICIHVLIDGGSSNPFHGRVVVRLQISINLKTSRVTRRVADMAEAEERPSGGGDDEKVKYPVGIRFQPTLRELVEFYLLPKLLDRPTAPNDAVIEADAYECDPEILTKRYEERGEDENWYFLSPRSRRYPGGDRPTRRTTDNRGRWKPSTGQSKPAKDAAAGHSKAKKGIRKNLSVGEFQFTENTLAYYVGDPRNETKTKWLMLELTVPEPKKERDLNSPTSEKPRDHMLLNKYVVCKIYKSPLKKWKELEKEEGGTSSAPACDEEVPTSSQSGPAPESSGEASALTQLSSKCAGKRPAAEQLTSEQADAPNKRASSQHTMPPGTPVPTPHANGGGMRVPPVGVGAAAGYYDYDYRGVPVQLPPLMHWPPAIYSSMQGPVQMQRRPPSTYAHNGQPPVQGPPVQMQRRPPSMYAHNGQKPVQQGPPVLKLYPPHGASATAPNALGQTVTMRPPNQPVIRPPSSFPRPPPPPQQQQQQMEDVMHYQQRVYAQLVAEMKLQKRLQESASCAGQQQQINIMPTASSTQPACFNEGANHPSGTKFTVPHTQFPAPHHNSNFYPCSGVQPQQQQSSPAIPAASVPSGAAALQ